MSAYDSPTIIKDLYGAGAWGKFAETVASSSNMFLATLNEARAKQAKISADIKKIDDDAYSDAEFAWNERNEANFDQEAYKDKDKSFVDQAKLMASYKAYGGEHMFNGEKRNFGIGSIAAEAKLKANNNLTKAQKKEYYGIVNNQKNSLKNSGKAAGLIMTDEKDWSEMRKNRDDYYVTGVPGSSEHRTNTLVANSLYGRPNGKGAVTSVRTYDQVLGPDGEDQTILKIGFDIDVKSPNAKAYILENIEFVAKGKPLKHKIVDGKIKVLWKRNLSDGSYDGNLVNKKSIIQSDLNTAAKDLNITDSNGELAPVFRKQLAPTEIKGKDGTVLSSFEWVDVNGIEDKFSDTNTGKAEEVARAYLSGDRTSQLDALNYLQDIGRSGLDIPKDINLKDLTDLFLGFERAKTLTHFNIGQDRDTQEKIFDEVDGKEGSKFIDNPNFNKFTNQKTNGFALVRRRITQEQIDQLTDSGVDTSQMEEGQEHYFYNTANKTTGKPKDGSDSSTKLTEKQDDVKYLREVLSGAARGTTGKKLKVNPEIYFKTPRNIPGTKFAIKYDVAKGGYYVGTINPKSNTFSAGENTILTQDEALQSI